MPNILVVNAGSSSIKYQLIDVGSDTRLASGLIERIGEPAVPGHSAAFALMLDALESRLGPLDRLGISAVGHRVVMGGADFTEPTLIDDAVVAQVGQLSELAPLHNPGNLQAIEAARSAFPDVPHVAVFDTAFHQSMPEAAYTYAIDRAVAAEHGIRRYGFHGISHEVVSRRAAHFLGRPVHELKQIVLHLGNGASVCAIDRGRSVATSMGLTPLEGLVMGTRSGDFDPGAILHLLRAGFDADALDALLNKRSGFMGLAGSNDLRDVRSAAEAGNADARLALDVYARRIRHYIGAYLAELDGADAIVFTAGVGENAEGVRADVCMGLGWFGIELDSSRNAAPNSEGARRISTDASRVAVLVVPTDEESEIARQTAQLVSS